MLLSGKKKGKALVSFHFTADAVSILTALSSKLKFTQPPCTCTHTHTPHPHTMHIPTHTHYTHTTPTHTHTHTTHTHHTHTPHTHTLHTYHTHTHHTHTHHTHTHTHTPHHTHTQQVQAVQNAHGLPENPLTIMWVCGEPTPPSTSMRKEEDERVRLRPL